MSEAFKQSNHFTVVRDDPTDAIARSKSHHPSNIASRWVLIGGAAFEVTPKTCYTHLLSNGRPYYPYYDPTLPTVPTTTSTTTTTTQPTVSQSEYDAWTRVAVCEEGGWGNYGFPNYPDSLGINSYNWYANGGGSDLSPTSQILVAERIQANPPDQNGSCAAW